MKMLAVAIPGQHINVNRGLYSHHGIYVGEQNGLPLVAELAKPIDGGRARLVTWATFSRGNAVFLVNDLNSLPHAQVLANVRWFTDSRQYDLLDWNCEHFATWCSTHQARSSQVQTVFAFAGVTLSLLLLGALLE